MYKTYNTMYYILKDWISFSVVNKHIATENAIKRQRVDEKTKRYKSSNNEKINEWKLTSKKRVDSTNTTRKKEDLNDKIYSNR